MEWLGCRGRGAEIVGNSDGNTGSSPLQGVALAPGSPHAGRGRVEVDGLADRTAEGPAPRLDLGARRRGASRQAGDADATGERVRGGSVRLRPGLRDRRHRPAPLALQEVLPRRAPRGGARASRGARHPHRQPLRPAPLRRRHDRSLAPRGAGPAARAPGARREVGADAPVLLDGDGPPRTGGWNARQLEIPKGRGAYTPDLRITYSSNNANGWMGLGWDIPIPSIQVDTRWGVPMYDPDKETESYLLSGQALAPVFKLFDDPATPRQSDRRFYKRVEGDFLKIIRKGNSPSNYSWEVTDKAGIKYYYGTTGGTRLADYQTGNIFQWHLEKVVDTNGNVTEYSYYADTQAAYLTSIGNPSKPPQTSLGGEDWIYLYLDKIAYTKNEKTGAAAQYTVEFKRDAGTRKDLTVGGKSGFKTALRFRLDRVDVKFKGSPIRSYQMSYVEGDFAKSLLDKIAVKGANGTEFYSHGFEYYALKRVPKIENTLDDLPLITGVVAEKVDGIAYFGFTEIGRAHV